MMKLVKKLFNKKDTSVSTPKTATVKDIRQTTNAVFDQYKKSFKDLARYDREGKVSAN